MVVPMNAIIRLEATSVTVKMVLTSSTTNVLVRVSR